MFKEIWENWKEIAHKIGNFQARAILTLFYLVVALPFALIVRLKSDPLTLRQAKPEWVQRLRHAVDLTDARRQF